ncbi:unnamed protein product, partial [Prorocentrum cordatum]
EASKEGASAAVDLSTTTTGTPGDLTATGSSALLSPEGPPAAARGAQRLGPAAEAYMEEQRRRGRRLGHAREGPSEPSSAGDPRAALDEDPERERFLAHLSALDAGPRWTWALEEGRGPSRPRPPPPPEQRGGSPGGCSAEPPGAPGAPPPTALDEDLERQRALDEDMAALEAVLQNLNSSRCSEPAGDARASTAPLRAAPARLPDSTVGAGEPQQDAPPSPQASVLGGGAPLIGALSTAERLLADLRAASRGRPPPHERRPPSGQRRAKRPGGEAAEQAPCLSDYLSLEARGSCSSLPAAAPERPSLSRSASSSLQGGQRKRAARGLDPLMFGSAAGLPRGLRAAAAPAGGALAGCLSLYQEVCERVYDSLHITPPSWPAARPTRPAPAPPPRRRAGSRPVPAGPRRVVPRRPRARRRRRRGHRGRGPRGRGGAVPAAAPQETAPSPSTLPRPPAGTSWALALSGPSASTTAWRRPGGAWTRPRRGGAADARMLWAPGAAGRRWRVSGPAAQGRARRPRGRGAASAVRQY